MDESTRGKTSCEAQLLIARLAEKIAEPLSDTSDPNKTIGEWRSEMSALHMEILEFERRRRLGDRGRSFEGARGALK